MTLFSSKIASPEPKTLKSQQSPCPELCTIEGNGLKNLCDVHLINSRQHGYGLVNPINDKPGSKKCNQWCSLFIGWGMYRQHYLRIEMFTVVTLET